MKLHSLILDDFLENFADWRAWADSCTYADEINPVDGVCYPGICRHVPTWGMVQRLSAIFGRPVKLNTCFMRLSLAGVPVPHQAHTDASMGQYSVMLYLNRAEHCQGGTSLVRHVETGMDRQPLDERGQAVWVSDCNIPQAWEIVSMCEMRPNRAFIFRADLMHRAEPLGGFGSDSRDGRLVLTGFFDVH